MSNVIKNVGLFEEPIFFNLHFFADTYQYRTLIINDQTQSLMQGCPKNPLLRPYHRQIPIYLYTDLLTLIRR